MNEAVGMKAAREGLGFQVEVLTNTMLPQMTGGADRFALLASGDGF
jgi:hypothetical protein